MEMAGFDENVIKTFRKLKLSTVDEISPQEKQLWMQRNGRMPRKHDARRCWVRQLPTDVELFAATIDQIQKSKSDSSLACSVVHRGNPDDRIDPINAVAQLYRPDPWNPLKLLDLRFPIFQDGMLKVPQDLSVDAYEADNLQIMLTPKHCCTQLHFGTAPHSLRCCIHLGFALTIADNADGLSIILGEGGKKIFATFPNSDKNMELFRSTLGREAKLEEIGQHLEAGLTFTINSNEAIDLPRNCFHAVWTLEGCFLTTMDFTTADSTKGYLQIISTGLDMFIGVARQKDLFDWFLTSFNIALENGRVCDALCAWIELLDRTREWARENPKWLKEATALCEKFMVSPTSLNQTCPCGSRNQEKGFRQHFKDCHLLYVSYKQGSDRRINSNPAKRRCRRSSKRI
jgi:hypothetical protein